MVSELQIVVVMTTVLVAVLGAFGAFIKWNYDVSRTLHQRLMGTDGDDTSPGFINETEARFDSLESQVQEHSRVTHEQLYQLDRKINRLIEASDTPIDRDDMENVSDPDCDLSD